MEKFHVSANLFNSAFIRCSAVDDFVAANAPRVQSISTALNKQPATGSTAITGSGKSSTSFNNAWNLVRDQRVGGSNPLSPTILFNYLQLSSSTREWPSWSSLETHKHCTISRLEPRQYQNRLTAMKIALEMLI
jgi:hypothetical protein